MDAPVVEVLGASVGIGGRPILRRIDLSIAAGSCVAVMGANGSGKSTLVRAMTGLWPLSSGEVRLFGTPLRDFTHWERVGFVPQRAGATGGVPASVREVVAAGRLTRRGLFRPLGRADRAAVRDAIAAVGMAGREDVGVATLSGGQQQRVLIARALAGEPDLFFLDEPTAGVDLPNQHALADALARLRARGATIVLVAHELGPMEPMVDRAVVMRDGRVAYDGPALTDEEVHQPHFGEHPVPFHAHPIGEGHSHHHPVADSHDHAPHVGAPLDSQEHPR